MGTLLANVELQPIEVGKGIKVENIYYDYNKADIRKDAAKELDNLISVLNDNPGLVVELGAHTDSRGRDSYNLSLSEKRARSAVKYILDNSIVDKSRINAKGYGETQVLNKCKNDVTCRESQHEVNRRTELKIVGFLSNDPYMDKSLADIIVEEKFEKMLQEVEQSEVYRVPEYTQPKPVSPPIDDTPPVPSDPPRVSTTPARPGTQKPFKPKTEEELQPQDFSNTPEGFEESITSDIGGKRFENHF